MIFSKRVFSLLQQEIPAGGAEDAVSAQAVCLLHLHKALLHLRAESMIAGIIYFSGNGLHHAPDYMALLALASVLLGVAYIIYLNRIHEKEIATRLQKNLSFGLTVYAGLAGAVIGIWQMALYAGASPALVWLVIGGFLNFASGLPVGYVLCYTLAHEGYGLLSVSCCVVTQL